MSRRWSMPAACGPIVLEISVMMAQYPSRRIAELSYRYRTLGLGYANLGALLMARGLGYDIARRPGHRRRDHRRHDRHRLRDLGRDGRLHGRLPGLRRQSRGHAAGHPQPPPRRPRRDARATKASPSRRSRSTSANCPDAPLVAAAKQAWDRALALGEQHGFRNAQVSVIAPDRHDRPGDGLRHHRHRTRLRAGQVQEAGGRRLLQDHQPDGPAGAAHAGLRRGGGRAGSWRTRSATARSKGAPAINHETLAARGFDAGDARADREGDLPTAFDIRFAFSRYTLGDDFCRDVLGLDEAALADPQARRAGAPRLLPQRHRRGERLRLRDDDRSRARPISSASISRCSIVQIPVDEMARAACLRKVTYA